MTRRRVLCEGPDDVAALREIGLRLFGAVRGPAAPALPPSGEERGTKLIAGVDLLEITASSGGKSALPRLIAAELTQLPPQVPDDEARVTSLWVVFDPDDKAASAFHADVETAVAGTVWSINGGGGRWHVQRGADQLELIALAWHSDDPVVDDLPDDQHLDRMLVAVAVRAFGDGHRDTVARWLREMHDQLRLKPRWKSALHLMCALTEPSASAMNAATRFLGQNKACAPHVEQFLRDAGVFAALQELFKPAP